ncbi:MAG: DrmE family protein, partial [Acidobacteria bacterium]|nr:DrmE family protein [Acidobacteriota bacterium]
PHELLLGDVLLRMDEGGRTSLFDRIVELAEDQPEMQYLATFRHVWRRAVQRLVARFGGQWGPNYVGMLLSLQSYGATIQSDQTVRSWVQDYVIGPDEVSSIIAVGRASGSEALVRQAKQFDAAFRRIRGIRQGIGRRLNSTIRKSFRHFTEGTVEPGAYQLDERLGIPLDELLETIDLAEIISVNKQEKRIALHHVGRFRHID